ncbi:hypothetical protein CL655_01980 [bacterium]|nr:hypothetical protein [bacterium]
MIMKELKSQTEKKLIANTLAEVSRQYNGPEAITQFIDNVLTDAERQAVGRRLLMARLYLEGYSGAEIKELLHVSPNMLSVVRKWVENLPKKYRDFYRNRTTQSSQPQRPRGRALHAPLSLARLRKNYPAHFLLFNLIDELKKQ